MRLPLAIDFGDAPDTGAGTGTGNYRTVLADDAPRHTIILGLYLGAEVDGEADGSPNALANGDDVLPDDEDGVISPLRDLIITAGSTPRISLRATNTTENAATLYGWIDFNGDGAFDNATERASAAVPAGSNNEFFHLAFSLVPAGFTGATYARFRLSTDSAAANSTGLASDGEVEDYAATIIKPSDGTVNSSKTLKIAHQLNGGPAVGDFDRFGAGVTSIGDLDGDGITDLVAGAPNDDTEGSDKGALYTLFMNSNGTVRTSQKIASGIGGGPSPLSGDWFGFIVKSIGDLDGDGITDLAVGAPLDDSGGNATGATYVVFLNQDGTAKSTRKLASSTGGMPSIPAGSYFGRAVAPIGDLNGDGIGDLVVGAPGDSSFGYHRGAAWVLFMNRNGTVAGSRKIASSLNGGPALVDRDYFGGGATGVGDIDGDGFVDVVLGSFGDDAGNGSAGAVYVLFLQANGTAKGFQKIAHGIGGGPNPAPAGGANLGVDLAALGDLDGNGITDIAVGAPSDGPGGAVYLAFLTSAGTARDIKRIGDGTNGGPALNNLDAFGWSVAGIGDFDGDGVADLAVGTSEDDTGGTNRGAIHLLFLNRDQVAPQIVSFTRLSPPTNPTASDVLIFRATFSEPAFQVEPADFVPTGTTATVTQVTPVAGSNGTQFDIAVSGGNLLGLVGMVDLNFSNPVISDAAGNVFVNAEPVVDESFTLALFSPDWGDAPDGATGTGPGNYRTRAADGGPSHSFYGGLYLGAGVDGEADAVLNARALGDDLTPDDEDGLMQVGAGLSLTTGTDPILYVRATNLTLTPATLYAWIDYNADGEFDNATERAIATVPAGADKDLVRLEFPTLNVGYTGATYARFRISQDSSAANSIGPASGGEVEDYAVTIANPSRLIFDGSKTKKIADQLNGGPVLPDSGFFGNGLAAIGDLDGDGIEDLAVGASAAGTGGLSQGAIYVLFMNADGTVDRSQTIATGIGNGPALRDYGLFGSSITNLGDLDGDGVSDLAVGAQRDDTGGNRRGAVYVLFMNQDGTVKASTKLAHNLNGGPSLTNNAQFGASLAAPGDLDGDGIVDLVVGAATEGAWDAGAIYTLLLNRDGSARSAQRIANGEIFATLGAGMAALGDVNGDGFADLAVSAPFEITFSLSNPGVLHILFLDADGSVGSSQLIQTPLSEARSVANAGDLDGDGVNDVILGSQLGHVSIHLLNSDGSEKGQRYVPGTRIKGGPTVDGQATLFGFTVAGLGDLDGDGFRDVAIAAPNDDTGGSNRGSTYITFLADPAAPLINSIDLLSPSTGRTNADELTFRVHFSTDVQNVDAADFAISGGSTATITAVSQYFPGVYDITVSGGNLGNYFGVVGLDLLPTHDITDLAGKRLVAAEPDYDQTYFVEHQAPLATAFERRTPAATVTNADSLVFRVYFNEAVDGVDPEDFVVDGSTAAVTKVINVGDSGAFDITISGGDLANFNGVVGLNFAPGVSITDVAGNVFAGAYPTTDQTYTLDNIRPTVTTSRRHSPMQLRTNADTLVFRVTFSEPVDFATDYGLRAFNIDVDQTATPVPGTNFTQWDITLSGGELPDFNGSVVLYLAVTYLIHDFAGNEISHGGFTVNESFVVDNIPATVTSIRRHTPTVEYTDADSLVFLVSFSDRVTGVDAADFVAVGTTADISVAEHPGSNGAAWQVTLSGGDLANLLGTVGLDIAGNATFVDILGMVGTPGQPAIDETYELTDRPTLLSIVRKNLGSEITRSNSLAFRVTFREPVQNVDAGDFVIHGTTATITNLVAVAGSNGTQYDLTVSGGDLPSLNGVVGINLATSPTIIDLDSRPLIVMEPLIDETYLLDNLVPVLLEFRRHNPLAAYTAADVLVFRAVFNEDITGMWAGAFRAVGTTASVTVDFVPNTVKEWDITLSGGDLATLTGPVGLEVVLGTPSDIAGNQMGNQVPAINEIYNVDNTPPTLSILRQSPLAERTNADTLVFHAVFDEAVANVDLGDFVVEGTTATLTVTPVSAGEYALSLSGGDLANLNGEVRVRLHVNQNIVDLAGHALSADPLIAERYLLDNVAPTLLSSRRQSPTAEVTNATSLVFRLQFSEDIGLFVPGALVATGTTAGKSLFDIDARTFDITLSGGNLGTVNGVVGLDLAANPPLFDFAGNRVLLIEPAIDETYTLDHRPPRLNSLERLTPLAAITNATTLVFRASFDEAVVNVDANDFTIDSTTTATIASVTPVTASTFDVTVSGGDLAAFNGSVRLTLAVPQNIKDVAGNSLLSDLPTINETYLVDHLPPQLLSFKRQAPAGEFTAEGTLVFEVAFSEPVNGLDAADFAVAGGTTASITNVATTDGAVYSVTISGGDLAAFNGVVQMNLAPGQNIADLAGNALPAGEPPLDERYTLDHNPPRLTAYLRQDPPVEVTAASVLVFRAIFNEAVVNVDAADFLATGTTATITNVAMVTPGVYDLTVGGGNLPMLTGRVGIDLAEAQRIVDLVGNPLPTVEPTIDESYLVDHESPAVVLARAASQTNPAAGVDVHFLVTFSEPVSGFDTDDLDFTGSTAAGTLTAQITGTGPEYDVVISGMTGTGIVKLAVKAAAVNDAAGNPSLASTGADNEVLWYSPAPLQLAGTDVLELQAGARVGPVTVPGLPAGRAWTLSVDDSRFEFVNGQLQLKSDQSVSLATSATIPLTLTLHDGVLTVSQSVTLNVQPNSFPWHNYPRPEDADGDGDRDIDDAIFIIRQIRRAGGGLLPLPKPAALLGGSYFDVDANGRLDVQDALAIIRYLRRSRGSGGGEGEDFSTAAVNPDKAVLGNVTSHQATDWVFLNWRSGKERRL